MLESLLHRAALRALLDPAYSDRVPDPHSFSLRLYQVPGVSSDDVITMVRLITGLPQFSQHERAVQLRELQGYVQNKLFARELEQASRDGITDDRRIRIREAMDFTFGSEEEFYNLSRDDHADAVRRDDMPEGGKIIRSSLHLVNSSSLYGGYKYGDIALIAGETGVGKSTLAVNEAACAIDQGFHVAHIILGDMSELDIQFKYTALWAGAELKQVAMAYEDYRTPLIRDKLDHLRVRAFPSGVLTIYDVTSKLHALHAKWPFDMLIIDHDGNFKDVGDLGMYKEGGNNYGQIEAFSRKRCVTIVLSQTKPIYWGQEIVPKDAPNESSKKQHVISFLLGLGRNPQCRQIGVLNLSKSRRGEEKMTHIHFDYPHARIHEVTGEVYEQLKAKHSQEKGQLGRDYGVLSNYGDGKSSATVRPTPGTGT